MCPDIKQPRLTLRTVFTFAVLVLLPLATGCSIRSLAVNAVADAISGSSSEVYASDDDPELVGQALPFGLKTIEALLRAKPNHKGLLIAAASGFVQYTYAYVLLPAEFTKYSDPENWRKARARAKRLFLRARGYGLRALELKSPGISTALTRNPQAAVTGLKKGDVEAMYWTGVAWFSAISVGKDDMSLVGDLSAAEALMKRALELDESWGDGAIHEFFIAYDAGRSEAQGGGLERAEMHFKRAMELSGGRSVAPLVSLAESVCVKRQNRRRFKELLHQALAFDVDRYPDKRLPNILAQRKAAHLLANIDELFFIEEEEVNHAPRTSSNTN